MNASEMTNWQIRAPVLVSLIGHKGFTAELDAALSWIAPFDLSCAFAYPGEARPVLLHDGLRSVSPAHIMEHYLNGTYLLDAVYAACQRRVPAGIYRLRDLAPDAFFEGEYYNSPEVHPCISMETGALSEEVVFIAPLRRALYVAYSLMRQNGRPTFSDSEMAELTQIAPMVAALLSQHWRGVADEIVEGEPQTGSHPDMIEIAFRTFLPSKLTSREQTIVSLILRGHSSLSIAMLLDIAEGTVKIHRKKIYSKLDISSQVELFNLFINHILAVR